MTYEQYRAIMGVLETRNEAARKKLQRDGLNPRYIALDQETQAAIAACKAAFYEPKTVIVRGAA